jgi:hypothetical protein
MKRFSAALTAILILTGSDFVCGQTQSLSFNDNVGVPNAGTYNPNDTFSFDMFLTFAGFDALGYSLWFDTTANAAPFIFLTGCTIGTTFPNPTQAPPYPLGFTLSEGGGLFTTPNPSDLGASLPGGAPGVVPGTYFIGHVSFSLSGLAPGTYVVQSAAVGGHSSVVGDTSFGDHLLPNTTYTITVVPEPSTFMLLAVAAISLRLYRVRRRAAGVLR